MEFKRLGKKLIACIVADTVCAAVLMKGNDGWQVDDMIPSKYLNAHRKRSVQSDAKGSLHMGSRLERLNVYYPCSESAVRDNHN